MADTNYSPVIEELLNKITQEGDFTGKDPETIYQTLKEMITQITKKNFEELEGIVFVIHMPGKEPDENGNIKKPGIVMSNIDNRLRALSESLSKGISTENENGKKPKFTVPLGRAEAESLRTHTKASAINYIQNKIRDAAFAAGWTEQDLHMSQNSVNFKNQGSRGASINTTGTPLIESLAEIIYTSSVHGKEMNVEGVKDNCEKNLGTKHDTGMQAGNMIDDMVNGGGDDIEKTNEGYTYSPS